MPIYTYRCDCGRSQDAVRKIDDRHNGPFCCGERTRLIISPVRLSISNIFMHYYDPGLGEHITSPKQRKYLQEKNGFVDAAEYWSKLPELGNEPEPQPMEVPADLWESMEREGKGDLLNGCKKDYDLAKYAID